MICFIISDLIFKNKDFKLLFEIKCQVAKSMTVLKMLMLLILLVPLKSKCITYRSISNR